MYCTNNNQFGVICLEIKKDFHRACPRGQAKAFTLLPRKGNLSTFTDLIRKCCCPQIPFHATVGPKQ